MNYNYNMNGGVGIYGCGKVVFKIFRYYKYKPGSVLYLCYKAKIGILEKIVIKQVIPKAGYKNNIYSNALYKDNLNFLYNEDELCSEANAVALAINYYENQLEKNKKLIRNCAI